MQEHVSIKIKFANSCYNELGTVSLFIEIKTLDFQSYFYNFCLSKSTTIHNVFQKSKLKYVHLLISLTRSF